MMKKKFERCMTVLVVLLVSAFGTTAVHALAIFSISNFTLTDMGGGVGKWTFDITNTSTDGEVLKSFTFVSDGSAGELDLSIFASFTPLASGGTAVGLQMFGWNFLTTGDLAPGATATGIMAEFTLIDASTSVLSISNAVHISGAFFAIDPPPYPYITSSYSGTFVTPEPTTLLLLGSGLFGFGAVSRYRERKRKKNSA